MKFPPTVKEFMEETGSISKDEFVDRFPEPFLLLEIGVDPANGKEYGTDSGKSAFKKTADIGKLAEKKSRAIFVTHVKKTERNSFHNMITVGRTPNNDIMIPHPCVSKFHAFFKMESGGSLSITDAGSSYGTKLEGKRLAPNRGYPLKGREVIVFAEMVRSTFLLPPDLHDYVRLL